MKFGKKILKKVSENVYKEIAENAKSSFYATGLSSEGYSGGYNQAIQDVLLAMNGVKPNTRFWKNIND